MFDSQNLRKIKIAVDARSLNRPMVRGIGKVLFNLLDKTSADIEWWLYADRPDLPLHKPDHVQTSTSVFEQIGYRFNLWEQYAFPRNAKRIHPDIVFSPNNSTPLWRIAPAVVCIHDTIPWQENWTEKRRNFLERQLDYLSLHRAARIITISESSAKDICARWPRLKSKISIIPNGVDSRYIDTKRVIRFSEDTAGVEVSQPYLVYFGGIISRKRLDWAVEVFRRLRHTNLTLVVCGLEANARKDWLSFRCPPEIRGRVIVADYLPEEAIPTLIANAIAVLYPTLFEGFGLPALESQACGTACLFSPVSSLKELIGPGAVVLPELDLGAWISAIDRLVQSNGLDLEIAESSRKWASKYSWNATADNYYNVFYEAAMARKNTTLS